MNDNMFEIEVSSDLDYERMVVNVLYLNNHIATLSCDRGIDRAVIEFICLNDGKHELTLDYKEFTDVIAKAFNKLKVANGEQKEV